MPRLAIDPHLPLVCPIPTSTASRPASRPWPHASRRPVGYEGGRQLRRPPVALPRHRRGLSLRARLPPRPPGAAPSRKPPNVTVDARRCSQAERPEASPPGIAARRRRPPPTTERARVHASRLGTSTSKLAMPLQQYGRAGGTGVPASRPCNRAVLTTGAANGDGQVAALVGLEVGQPARRKPAIWPSITPTSGWLARNCATSARRGREGRSSRSY